MQLPSLLTNAPQTAVTIRQNALTEVTRGDLWRREILVQTAFEAIRLIGNSTLPYFRGRIPT